MKRVLILTGFLAGCSLGPVKVTHMTGSLPKVHVEVAEDIKVRVSRDKIALIYKHRF